MNPPVFHDSLLRIREQQRASLLAWVIARSSEPGIVTGQTLTAEHLDILLKPAQSFIVAVLDEPGGERLQLAVHPNGSIVLEMTIDELNALDDIAIQHLLPEISERISELFHNDALQFVHSISHRDGQCLLRTVTSLAPDRRLTEVVSETLAVSEIVLHHVHAWLVQGDARD